MASGRILEGGGGQGDSFSAGESFSSRYFYRHGLYAASHPRVVLVFCFALVFTTTSPLFTYIPLLSHRPKIVFGNETGIVESESSGSLGGEEFASSKPLAYVQQVLVKAMVHPYRKDRLITKDAFRGPLATAFKLHLEHLTTFKDSISGSDMDHECLRTDGLSRRYRSMNILPEYGCLILSPANLWSKDSVLFQMDPQLVSTVFNYQRSREGHSSLADLVFGLRQRETGITKYPIRNRQRVISYAATIALKRHNRSFVEALGTHLRKLYPLNQQEASSGQQKEVVHIHFPPIQQYYGEMLPLLITIFILFLYVYFSCNRIEVVKSKFGIAASAVIHVLGAICMSLGMSGLSLDSNPKVYFVPYLVAFVSLENILVVTRSVIIDTPSHLDVKMRVAQGLSREGGNITKALLVEVTVLTVGFVIGVVASDTTIQEFCLLAVMGLLADYFLQLFFFVTVLSMDMTKLELSDVLRRKPAYPSGVRGPSFRTPVTGPGFFSRSSREGHGTSVLAPNCNGKSLGGDSSTSDQGGQGKGVRGGGPKGSSSKEARRVKLMGFFAKKRFIQRAFVLFSLFWFSFFIYQGEMWQSLLRHYESSLRPELPPTPPPVHPPTTTDEHQNGPSSSGGIDVGGFLMNLTSQEDVSAASSDGNSDGIDRSLTKLMSNEESEPWQRLPVSHWPMLFGLYNMSLYGQHIAILPPIQLSMTISPEIAVSLRHPKELAEANQRSGSGLDGGVGGGVDQDVDDGGSPGGGLDDLTGFFPELLTPFAPTSPSELLIAVVFATPSILFILYSVVMLYRCCCSKNYAEWRASWKNEDGTGEGPKDESKTDIYTQMIQESSLMQLEGHYHEVEYLVADCNTIVSMCLGGHINVWDTYTGQKTAEIDRKQDPSLRRPDVFDFPGASNNSTSMDESLVTPQRNTWRDDSATSGVTPPSPNLNFSMLLNRSSEAASPATPSPVRLQRYARSMSEGRSDTVVSPSTPPHRIPDSPSAATLQLAPSTSTVWAMEYSEGLLLLGCSDGRIEIWDATNGTLKCSYADPGRTGVTHLKVCGGWKVVAARISGSLDLFNISSTPNCRTPDVSIYTPSSSSKSSYSARKGGGKTHSRSYSECGVMGGSGQVTDWLEIRPLCSHRAHQQPITCLEVEQDTILTGSQDHTVRILRVTDRSFKVVYTLHGHCGPITTAFLDSTDLPGLSFFDHDDEVAQPNCGRRGSSSSPSPSPSSSTAAAAGSGSQDGMLCLWDAMTGACLYSIQAHDGRVISTAHSPSYVVSMGEDGKLCVWERFHGHLINSIHLSDASPYCQDLVMLTHNLLVTAGGGTGAGSELVVWDVRLPDVPVRRVRLGSSDTTHGVSILQHFGGDSVACNYGNQLKIVRFPMLTDKRD